MSNKLGAENRRQLREIERLSGVSGLRLEPRPGHTRVWLPDGRYITTSCSGDINAARQAARDIKRKLRGVY